MLLSIFKAFNSITVLAKLYNFQYWYLYFQEYNSFIQTIACMESSLKIWSMLILKCFMIECGNSIQQCALTNTGEVCKWLPVQTSLVIKLFTIVCGQQFLKVDLSVCKSQITRFWEPSSIHKSKQLD